MERLKKETGLMDDPRKMNSRIFNYYPRLEKVKRYVDHHFPESVNLSRAADVAGLEKTYFSRFFHDKTGVCFHAWLNWVRVNHAMEIMKSRDLPITEIALAVGFQDLRTFERAVKKCTGTNPRALKSKLRPCAN